MFLKLDEDNSSLQLVYQLSEELKNDPEQVAMAQALTQDESRPFGLKGTHGLFGSDEWWDNLRKGVLPVRHVSGVIERLFVSGQEKGMEANTFDLLLNDGGSHTESIFVDSEKYRQLFKVGSRVEILYALDELKMQPAPGGRINYSEIVVEMAVSK
ncbi:hypothetical protein [Gynuella sunshinyii]|uniref:Uncharacterized protein n=1 Tax=Gynuella sunshinyii YC6258 TaxID=1445510 RepID=A0A0C5VHP8_9GAMM|nr:hypothetical protein [Gynuella sunshinyii]AJQ94187.1 hypothetical Protein YC6258_02149 [Gynuella sunshinyii YC6258]